jgi:predicted HD phosphohydrolase|tara:strand:+ start:839 stop:1165 length:327 start_codon:yes stop_codon:yes gene_type:complete
MSEFFKSSQVQQSLQDIFNTYQEIAVMSQHLPDMSKEQRLEHIEDCKYLIDKQKTFYFRLSLAAKDDPEAADMKNRVNALTSAFGYKDMMDCMDAMVRTLENAAKNGS